MIDERQILLRKLRRKRVTTIDGIAELFGCVVRSAHRKLKVWKGIRSCNMNGRYYTLPEIPEFDRQGLWRYEDIVFSQHGNLKETVFHLLDQSPAGLTAVDVAQFTGIKTTSSFLYQLRDSVRLEWEKSQGKAVFFSLDHKKAALQKRERQTMKVASLPSCEDAVLILVELIKNPKIEISSIAGRLHKMGRMITSDSIRLFLRQHDLLKKTQDTCR